MTHSRDSNWRPPFLEGERLGLPLAALVWGAREPCNGPVDPGLLATSGGHGRSGWWRDTGSGSSDERSVPSREVLPLRAGRRLGWGRGLASREGPELQVFVPASLFPAIFGSRFLDAWDKGVRMTCKRRGQSVPDPLDPFAPPDGSCAPGVAFWGVTTEMFRAVRPCATVRRGPDPARELTVCRPGYEPAGARTRTQLAVRAAPHILAAEYLKSSGVLRVAGRLRVPPSLIHQIVHAPARSQRPARRLVVTVRQGVGVGRLREPLGGGPGAL